jgi:hypothetical protein
MSLEEQLREIQQRIKQVKGEINETEANLENAEKIDTDSIKAKINNAENINNQIRAKQRNDSMDKKQKEAQKIYDDFTEKINKILKAKEEALAKAKMPIEGLGISETGVTYKDIPFSQLSSSEQLKISLSIAIALNPKLKVIRITDGSLLDDDNMKLIKEMATNWDYQVWIERVNDQNEIAFIIEDGEIKGGK